ncbi:hypothetical protein BBP40_007229 [Aspergillus hancockii]|nr:hypothetical protein BBP40_007229 [Aspergillus hancockii]
MEGVHDYYEDTDQSATISALRFTFCDVWKRIVKGSTPATQRRIKSAMDFYCQGAIKLAKLQAGEVEKELEQLIKLRRRSVGAAPCLPLAEFALKIQLPDKFFQSPAAQRLQDCVCDLVFLELKTGSTHNIVCVLRNQGYTQQQAYAKVDKLLHERYETWFSILADIPIYNEQTEVEIRKYVDACEKIVLANLNWRSKSENYFGSSFETVTRTRVVQPAPDSGLGERSIP